MKYIIPREAQSGIVIIDPDAGAVDITCHVRAVEFDESVDSIDIGTFCDAAATAAGSVSRAVTLEFRQSFGDGTDTGAYEDMIALVDGAEHVFQLTPWGGASVDIQFDTEFPLVPLGRFEPNAANLPDMNLAVRNLVVTPKTP